jgi:hypothetical protein
MTLDARDGRRALAYGAPASIATHSDRDLGIHSRATSAGDSVTQSLTEPRVPRDNNATERPIGGIAVGRRNDYGSKTQRGTEVAAILFNLVESRWR